MTGISKVWLSENAQGDYEVMADIYGIGAGCPIRKFKYWRQEVALKWAKKYAKKNRAIFAEEHAGL